MSCFCKQIEEEKQSGIEEMQRVTNMGAAQRCSTHLIMLCMISEMQLIKYSICGTSSLNAVFFICGKLFPVVPLLSHKGLPSCFLFKSEIPVVGL